MLSRRCNSCEFHKPGRTGKPPENCAEDPKNDKHKLPTTVSKYKNAVSITPATSE
uniref:Uncharacterized protein n=1 Tax=Tetraselmis sp. GSL018 TaxID=582737 RepID=A0A061RVT0_9CHLO